MLAVWRLLPIMVSGVLAAVHSMSPAAVAAEKAQSAGVSAMHRTVRVAYLHHSTGEAIWQGGVRGRVFRAWESGFMPRWGKTWLNKSYAFGVPGFFDSWNAAHGTDYRITRLTYPATTGGYPWANYPYDYWNLWVAHSGERHDRGELNLDDLVRDYDVIVFKHCFPVSQIVPQAGVPDVALSEKAIGNYKLQYEALKRRLRQFPTKQFVLWTGPVLARSATDAGQAQRTRQFFDWVRSTWDEKGDNIFLWDFYSIAADEHGFLAERHESAPGNSHPGAELSRVAAALIARRIVDVIEGRGDSSERTGLATEADGSKQTRR